MKLIPSTLIALILISCSAQVDREKLIGTYIWNEGREDTLTLNSDSTYYYWTKLASGKIVENSGQWTLNSNGNEIRFDDFSFLTDGYPKGVWISRLRMNSEEINLMYASEENIYFKKINERK